MLAELPEEKSDFLSIGIFGGVGLEKVLKEDHAGKHSPEEFRLEGKDSEAIVFKLFLEYYCLLGRSLKNSSTVIFAFISPTG